MFNNREDGKSVNGPQRPDFHIQFAGHNHSFLPLQFTVAAALLKVAVSFEKISNYFKSYKRDEGGQFAIMLSLFAFLLIVMIGGAIDFNAAQNQKSKLQTAADSASLAGARFATLNPLAREEAIRKEATRYFFQNCHAKDCNAAKPPIISLDGENNLIQVDASLQLKTNLLGIIGINKIDVNASAKSNFGRSAVEIALVLDNSGSLNSNGGKIRINEALDVVLSLLGPDEDLGGLYVSVIPWAGTVNIGLQNSDWLFPYNSSLFVPDTWSGCVQTRDNGFDTSDAPPSLGNMFDPFHFPPVVGRNEWDPNMTSESFIDFSPYPGGAQEVGPNMGCLPPMLPLTNRKSNIEAAIRSYQNTMSHAVGTFTSEGLSWGFRALSPRWQGYWKSPTPSTMPSNTSSKYVILFTDGRSQWNPGNWSPWGEQLAYSNYVSLNNLDKTIESRAVEVCKNMQLEGINVITIGYLMELSTTDFLRTCASSPEFFHHVPDEDQISSVLADVFKQIQSESEPRLIH